MKLISVQLFLTNDLFSIHHIYCRGKSAIDQAEMIWRKRLFFSFELMIENKSWEQRHNSEVPPIVVGDSQRQRPINSFSRRACLAIILIIVKLVDEEISHKSWYSP